MFSFSLFDAVSLIRAAFASVSNVALSPISAARSAAGSPVEGIPAAIV
jgi:hypothetical protein